MSARNRAARRRAGAPTPSAAGPSEAGFRVGSDIPTDRRSFLEGELQRAWDAREEAKPGSQAWAALARQIRTLREELDALRVADSPTASMTATEILDRVAHIATALPEPILAIYATEWARRHRVVWAPAPASKED